MISSKEILLESGANDFGILEFKIDGNSFGINVAKVQEIMKYCPVKPMQKSHSDVEGIFKPRDIVITVIDLARHLGLQPSGHTDQDVFIITNFSRESYAFHVHEVVGINRISWTNLQKPDEIIYGNSDGIATAIAEYDNRLITVLDFEKVIADINPDSTIRISDIDQLGSRTENNAPLLVVEDSMMLSRMVTEALTKAGYTNIGRVKNGEEAWNLLLELKQSGKSIKDVVSCIITDVEMPLMNGHRLIKLIKEDEVLNQIPIVIFSSLTDTHLENTGRELGAAGQFSKRDIIPLIEFVDKITHGK